jgi:hypothetical protein
VAKLEANQGDNLPLKNNPNNVRIKNNDESGVAISHSKGSDNITTSQGLTTAELAMQTSTNKAAWNTWASKSTIGDTRHHPQAGSWRLLGKVAPASGGPERWMWEPAG